ncbi:MAG: mercuric reductase [Candidatus Dadabacteria bacterium]|nr:MAG: mercuric reductase [Candidatus Dadabacteria bacterium]
MTETYPFPPAVDDADRRRLDLVHPADWTNPDGKGRYDLVVIGAGAAGLVTAAGAAGLGARVALIERNLLGGDCLNVGCVPSKGLIRAARAIADVRDAAEFGVSASCEPDFAAALARMRRIRAEIAPVDSAARFRDELGVDVFIGDATFADRESVVVRGPAGDRTLQFRRAVIASGARAAVPPVPGLVEARPLTNETVFNLTERPARLFVVGGGPIGCELAQSFARFGTTVTIGDMADRVLPRDEPDASARVRAALERDGVRLCLGIALERVERREDGVVVVTMKRGDRTEQVEADEILVAAGRKANIDGLGCEAAGVETRPRGVTVDARLRTTNKRIFACGDVAIPWQFTHTADATARIVIQNALFFGRKRWTDLVVPWVTYTDPEVAHVGKTRAQLDQDGTPYDVYRVDFDDLDRALLDGEPEGFAEALTEKGGERIFGATIVARHAGEMIGELVLAMTHGIGLGGIASTIHPYPTQSEAIRKLGDAYNRTRLTPRSAGILQKLIRLRRVI